MRFSQRIGKTPVKTILQVESIDEALMNRLWNTFLESCFTKLSNASYGDYRPQADLCKGIWVEFFGYRLDEIPAFNSGRIHSEGVLKEVDKWFFAIAEWYEVFDFIEFIAGIDSVMHLGFIENTNKALELEVSGYRIVESKIVQITSEEELEAIEQALNDSSPLKSVNEHLKTALLLLADRQSPNYRNSIKESISAVEAFCKVVTNDDKATLGKALAILEKQHNLHTSLKEAYSKLYGFTSDAGGIRHAMLEDGIEIDFADAKYMLVLCSSFINYIKAKLKL